MDGTTCTSIPRSAIRNGVRDLIPRSTATTRKRRSPVGCDHVRRGRRDLVGEVCARHRWSRPDPLAATFRIDLDAGHRDAHRAPLAEMASQRPRVDVTHAHDALRPQLRIQAAARPPARRHAGGITNHVAGHPDPPGFVVLVVPPGIADVRGRRDHDLPVVTRVRQGLLVARHRRGEDRLTYRLADRSERMPVKGPAVFENQECRRWVNTAMRARSNRLRA